MFVQATSLLAVLVGAIISPSYAAPTNDNPCVSDVEAQFRELDRHGDAMGFYLGLFSGDTICIDDCTCPAWLGGSHYQGIVRKPGSGTPFFYISKNNGPEVLVVQMGSRDTDGERLRSNRLAPGFITAITNPAPGDGEIATADFSYFEYLDDAFGFDHVGGMQTIGDTLVASVEGGGEGAVVFLDISNPAFPVAYHTLFLSHANGSNAIARLDDGRYLLLVGGGSNFLYVSNVEDLHDPSLYFHFIGELSLNVNSPPFGYNHINFVKQCDGTLYLIGLDRKMESCEGPFSRAELWKVNLARNFSAPGSVSATQVGFLDLNCNNFGEGVTCDFKAAAGTYVSPSGELILYGTVHQRGDPFTAFAEFRRRDIVHPDAQPWVQLYSNPWGWNSPFGQSIVFDMPDRHKDDFLNFPLLDFFDNSASSVRWWAPAGCCIELIANTCISGSTGTVFTLEGSGQVESIGNLATTAIGDNNVSAVRFCFDAVEPFGCNQPQTCPASSCQAVGPDLIVLDIVADPCVNVGQSIPGTVTIQNVGNEPAFGFMDIGFSLSLDDNPFGGGEDIPMGILDLNLNPPLLPGDTRDFAFNTFFVPNNAALTEQNLFACVDLGSWPCGMICEACETNNCSSFDVQVALPDVGITDITYASPAVSGELVTITVTIRNYGCDPVCNSVTACIGGNCFTLPFCVGPFGTEEVDIDVFAPPSEPDCGAVDYFNVSACLNFLDAYDGNNCRFEIIGIIEQFWDLDLSITSGDDSAALGDDVDYTVRVANHGNVPSPSCIAFITGINCIPGPGQWGCVLDSVPFTQIGSVQPGQTKTFSIGLDIPNCCAPPIIIGDQWLKAEILYTQGELCDDDCGEGFGNNLHQELIRIELP